KRGPDLFLAGVDLETQVEIVLLGGVEDVILLLALAAAAAIAAVVGRQLFFLATAADNERQYHRDGQQHPPDTRSLERVHLDLLSWVLNQRSLSAKFRRLQGCRSFPPVAPATPHRFSSRWTFLPVLQPGRTGMSIYGGDAGVLAFQKPLKQASSPL